MPPKSGSKAAVSGPRHRGRAASSGVVLNLDILRHILSFVEKHKDLLAAMLTCRALYHAGIQPLVRLPITVWDDTLPAFHDFMLSHSPATFLAFREFEVNVWEDYPTPEHESLIVELLKRGTKLRQVKLPHTVFDNEAVEDAIVSLTGLKTFVATHGFYVDIDDLLDRLHAPLTEVEIILEHLYPEDWDDDEDPIDPVLLLSNFQDTLERATISSAPFFSTGMDACYPKLLNLELHLSGGSSLSVLATAFPNLQTLIIDLDRESAHGRAVIDDEELMDLRNENLDFQEDHKCWESLTSVQADSDTLYAMGLKNILKFVTITHINVNLSLLRTLISTTNTENLSLHLPYTPDASSEVFSDGLGNPLESLKKKKLTLMMEPGANHKKILDGLLKGLASVTAVIFEFTLNGFEPEGLGRPGPEDKVFLHNLDERTFATQIGASMRNVACIFLKIRGRKVSHWMNTAAGTDKKEWTKVRRGKTGMKDKFSNFVSHITSIVSAST